MSEIISPENYVLKFGKYKNMRAIDVSELYQVDKDGNDKPVGLLYLKWLVSCDWFKHKETIQKIIELAESTMSDPEDAKPEQEQEAVKPKKEKKEKKEPEQKEKKTKKSKEPVVKNVPESRIIDFE